MATSDSPLNVPNVTLAVARGAGTGAPGTGDTDTPIADLPAGTIVNDGFESADRSAPGYPDFEWFGESGSIVTQVDANTGRVVYTGGGSPASIDVSDVDWAALAGDHSLRISYVGEESYQDPEQEWRLVNNKAAGVSKLWMRYALRVPNNYRHTSESPSNAKLCAIQMDGYSQNGTGATMLWEYWGDGNGGANLAVHWNEGVGGNSIGHQQFTPFISYPDDQGRWMYVCFQMVASSSIGATDGIVRMWRRWANESSWTLFHERTDARLDPPDPATGYTGWARGYLMGAVRGMPDDGGTGERVNFLIDEFTVSTESLL